MDDPSQIDNEQMNQQDAEQQEILIPMPDGMEGEEGDPVEGLLKGIIVMDGDQLCIKPTEFEGQPINAGGEEDQTDDGLQNKMMSALKSQPGIY